LPFSLKFKLLLDYGSIPAVRMKHLSKDDISRRAQALAEQIVRPELEVSLIDGESVIGGGAAPSAVLPTRLLALSIQGLSAKEFADQLRSAETPVIVRVEDGRVLIDLRTVFPEQIESLVQALDKTGTTNQN